MASSANLRKEALQLYREIVRTSKVFAGQLDANGKDYAALLSASARKEFEDSRSLTSREDIFRRIVIGRDALHQIHEQVRVDSCISCDEHCALYEWDACL